jgi:hypothetical protein
MFPDPAYIAAITEDRLREAEAARTARQARDDADVKPPTRRRPRRLRALATRIAFTSLR